MNQTVISNSNKLRRIGVFLLLLTSTLVISLVLLVIGMEFNSNGEKAQAIVTLSSALLVLIVGGISLRMYHIATRQLFHKQDEQELLLVYKSGFYSFVASLYIMIFMMLMVEVVGYTRLILYIAVLMCFVVFIAMYSLLKHQISRS